MPNQTMKKWKQAKKLFNNSEGQGLVEYALILVLIAIVVMSAIKNVGTTASSAFSSVDSSMQP